MRPLMGHVGAERARSHVHSVVLPEHLLWARHCPRHRAEQTRSCPSEPPFSGGRRKMNKERESRQLLRNAMDKNTADEEGCYEWGGLLCVVSL